MSKMSYAVDLWYTQVWGDKESTWHRHFSLPFPPFIGLEIDGKWLIEYVDWNVEREEFFVITQERSCSPLGNGHDEEWEFVE